MLLLLGILSLQAVEWRNWDAGQKEAKVTKKIIMIDAVREGCHYCEDMDRDVFDDKKMSQLIEERFIPVKIDLSHEKMPFDLHVSMTPSFYFMDQEMQVIKTIPGSWGQDDFKEFLSNIK